MMATRLYQNTARVHFKVLADVLGLGDAQIGKLRDAKIIAGPSEFVRRMHHRSPRGERCRPTPVQRLGVVLAHLTQPYQPSPKLQSGRPAHRPFRGLLGVHSRCGPHTRAVTYT